MRQLIYCLNCIRRDRNSTYSFKRAYKDIELPTMHGVISKGLDFHTLSTVQCVPKKPATIQIQISALIHLNLTIVLRIDKNTQFYTHGT